MRRNRRKTPTPTGNEAQAPQVFVDNRKWGKLGKIALYDADNQLITSVKAETEHLFVMPGDKVVLTVHIT